MFESTPFYEYATITFGQLFFYFLYISPVVILISYIICNKLKTKKILSEDKLEFIRVVLGFGLIIFLGCLLFFLLVFLKNTNETSFEKLEFAHTITQFETLSQSKYKYILGFERKLFANYIKIENRLIIFEKEFVDLKYFIKLQDNIDFLLLLFSKLNSSEKEAILDSLYKYVSDGLFQEFEFYLIQHKINSYYTPILKEKLDKERIYNDFKKSDN